MFFKVMEFLGTVAAFWFSWKILDWTIGQIPLKKKDNLTLSGSADVSGPCSDCRKKSQRITELEQHVISLKNSPQAYKYQLALNEAQKEIALLKDEVHRLKMLLPSVLNILNEAPKDKLKEIRGIGRRRSDAILSSRPFTDIQDAERKLGGKTLAVVLKSLDPEFKDGD